MKTIKYLIALILLGVLLTGCDEHHFVEDYDNTPPAPPTGIGTITGDNRIDIYWDHNDERDVAGYNVYYAYTYDGKYTLIGSTESDYFIDYDAVNGETYYYAVTAYDYNGNESELSYAEIYDTPRPEGFNQVIFDYNLFPYKAGYDFSEFTVGHYEEITDDYSADVFFEYYEDGKTFYLDVYDDSQIRDMGPTTDIYDVSVAPDEGWSPTFDEVAIEGHTYVIRTFDGHYAKLRINRILNDRVSFDWAYQTSETPEGYRELKEGKRPIKREPLNTEMMKKKLAERNRI